MTDDLRDTSSATWKFEFEDTVNADPLAKGACLKVVRVMLNFASKSDPRAFRSLPDLMMATGSTRPTVKKAIKTLVRLGYMVPLYITDGGSMMYRLVNARKQLIDDHLKFAAEKLAAERADRKKRERDRRGKETCPPENDNGERNFPPKVKETYPNTVELNRRGILSEGREESLQGTYQSIDDDMTIPFAVPRDEEEAEEILSHASTTNPTILTVLRKKLMKGELTPFLLLYGFQEAAQ
ncbi:biotin operon repressor [Rhizobium mesoamericanum]|uniref:hypothetical protein n=1 Tax=Rhizobium mesoamericanum TaxID=1079800 RepID=UPI002783DA16|nr:hypothetical protein [Rhizobium mesoamericanum]MDQ0558707.1 biotin operon repressor [Rhizobium mesoamericanum]